MSHRRRLAVCFSLCALLALPTCEGCDPTAPGEGAYGPYPEISPQEAATFDALCGFLERCPSPYSKLAYRDRAECRHILHFLFTCRLDVEEDAFDNNVFTLEQRELPDDPAAHLACQIWLNEASCDDMEGGNNSPCTFLGNLYAGQDEEPEPEGPAGAGERCHSASDCVEEWRCLDLNDFEAYPVEDADYCSVCVPPSGAGEDCATPPHYCLGSDEVFLLCHPQRGVCVSGLALDDACEVSGWPPCDAGLFCDAGGASCQPRLAQDAACAADGPPCVEGLHCSLETAICRGPEADGALCWAHADCLSEFCNYSIETTWHVGRCDPLGREGDPCSDDGECRSSDCEASVGVCIDQRGDGVPCVRDVQCWSGTCDTEWGLCGLRASGAACSADAQCRVGRCDPAAQRCGLADGASCSWDGDCLGGSCNSDGGTCTTRVELGASCDNDGGCLSNHCRGGVCTLRCEENRDCAAGEFCDWDMDSCRPQLEVGERCDDTDACRSGYCTFDEVCADKPDIGDACSYGFECYPRGYCRDGECRARIAPGGECHFVDACQDPFVCVDSVCTRMNLACTPAAAGELCAWLRVCAADAYCDVQDDFTCQPRRAAGDDCLVDEACAAGLRCWSATCQRPPAAGEPCDAVYGCDLSMFCDSSATPAVCQEQRAAGEPCQSDRECLSDWCSGQVCMSSGGDSCVVPEVLP